MEQLATYRLSPIFRTLKSAVEGFRDVVLVEAATIMKREEQASIRARWYRTGATLNSLAEQTVTNGNTKTYQLFPTTFYAPFGEYGTGRAGSATGRPAPRGYTYGSKPGMAARRYSRIAVAQARPLIAAKTAEQARRFAANMTR